MLEKSHTNLNDTDVTRVKSVDANSELTLTFKPSTLSSATQTTNEETTRSYDTGSRTDIQLEIGSVVKNTYELIAVLGEGGMGTVFKALNKDWAEVGARDPYVALKVLKPELSDNRDLVMGLFREFDRTKMLANCPNNIKVHDFGRDGSNVFMTMEYLTGQTLSEYISRQPMTLVQAWFIIEGVGNALAFAHEHNIVHRDIKPGNIFITKEGIVKVLDFGIASKINENEDDKTKFNGDDIGAFTLAYASPDTRLGDDPDRRDDIYSFACVIYEILTGKKFFDQKSKRAAPIHGLNSKQMEALNKALAFERDMRTGTIHELLEKLRPVKIPWLKYGSIVSGAILIIATVLWNISGHEDDIGKKLTEKSEDVAKVTAELKAKEDAAKVAAELKAKEDAAKVAAELKAEEDAAKVAAELKAEEDAAKVAAELKVEEQGSYSSTSSDGIVYLQTSKPEYRNGESFQLSFTLTQPRYVRVIDRDAKGEITTLRPNPQQPDKLLPADKEHVFPPKGIDTPVQGISGNSTVTIVASTRPFSRTVELLNADGSVSEQVQSGSYSWTQVHYTLR